MNSENHGFHSIRRRRSGLRQGLLCSIGLETNGAGGVPASAGLTDFSLYWSAEYQQTGPTIVVCRVRSDLISMGFTDDRVFHHGGPGAGRLGGPNAPQKVVWCGRVVLMGLRGPLAERAMRLEQRVHLHQNLVRPYGPAPRGGQAQPRNASSAQGRDGARQGVGALAHRRRRKSTRKSPSSPMRSTAISCTGRGPLSGF